MRVVFLSSAYCSYVHTYIFDPAAYSDTTEPEPPIQPTLVAGTEAQQISTVGDTLLARLTAWAYKLMEEATC